MTESELAVIKARADAATEGPWESEIAVEGWYEMDAYSIRGPKYWTWDGNMLRPDAEFIAHARTDVPKLVAQVERLRARVEELKQEVARHWPVDW